ncbi:MAG: ParE toxin of type toxin-antitoxin system, parDE [Pseudomonadota bacterium]
MREVLYNDDAITDLIEIGIYTEIEWGGAQWELYRALLIETCEQIIPRELNFARAVPERPGLLRWRCEQHQIYFRVDERSVEILRILHERMLPARHL